MARRSSLHKLTKKKNRKRIWKILVGIVVLCAAIFAYVGEKYYGDYNSSDISQLAGMEYNGEVAVELNYGAPEFTKDELKYAVKRVRGFESYSRLDRYGRCGVAEACLCQETMPSEGEERTSLSSVTPSGWQRIGFWERCHLIGYQLCSENANKRNLITGCNYFNVEGMLPYENMVAEYLRNNPDNHVLYRVQPVYSGSELVARGVIMQAESIEDKGSGICFNVFIFNYQPGYIIDYKKGYVEDDPDYQTTIKLADTVTEYTGDNVSSVEAKVKGSTGEIRYIYYTDRAGKHRTTAKNGSKGDGNPPSRPGTYYVRAIAEGDNWYPSATSRVAKMVIKSKKQMKKQDKSSDQKTDIKTDKKTN